MPRALFATLAQQGIAGATIGVNYSGLGLDSFIYAKIIEELAAEDLGVAVFISVHSMVSNLIEKFASTTIKEKYLPALASGTLLGAFALTEPSAGSDAGALKMRAVNDKNSYILNGEKCYITSAGFADLYLVFAKTNPEKQKAGISAFLVPADSPGLSISKPEKKMGAHLSPIASLSFANVSVPEDHRIGAEDNGYAVALSGLAGGRINIAACALGVARTALSRALKHVQERSQFGSKIAEFQGIQFMLADMQMKLEAARLLTRDAAAQLASAPEARANRIKASMAKCYATDAAMDITTDAVQLLGGAGYIAEYGVEQLMRDAKMLQIVEGTNQIQRAVIAREMLRD